MGTLRARRIVESAAFSQAFKRAQADPSQSAVVVIKSPHFVVSARPQSIRGHPQSRLGLIIAKRFLKSAADRNRFKRLIRQYFVVELLSGRDVFVRLSCKPGLSSHSPLYRQEVVTLWQDLLIAIHKKDVLAARASDSFL